MPGRRKLQLGVGESPCTIKIKPLSAQSTLNNMHGAIQAKMMTFNRSHHASRTISAGNHTLRSQGLHTEPVSTGCAHPCRLDAPLLVEPGLTPGF
jgi:hypothetical protein